MSNEWVSAGSASPEPAKPNPAGLQPADAELPKARGVRGVVPPQASTELPKARGVRGVVPPQASTEPATVPGPNPTEPSPAGWPEPIGRPARPHWWSIQKPPPAEPISTRRAYTEVLAVFAAFFAAGIVAGAETLEHRYPAPSGSWAVFTPAAISEVTTAALAVAVAVLLSNRRGVTWRTLGLGLPKKANGGPALVPAFRTGVWAIVILVVGGAITTALATGHHLVQPVRQDNGYLVYATAAALAAGVVEETVVLAFLVTTLRQAGRPLLEILAVAVLLRCSYHDYYGPGVIGIAVWAAVFVWLFLRTGSVMPLIVVHFIWDATIFWGQRWHWISAAMATAAVVALIAATVTWIAEIRKRNGGGRPRPGGRSGATYTAWPFAEQPDQTQPDQTQPDQTQQPVGEPDQLDRQRQSRRYDRRDRGEHRQPAGS